jgi:hypothetical protein
MESIWQSREEIPKALGVEDEMNDNQAVIKIKKIVDEFFNNDKLSPNQAFVEIAKVINDRYKAKSI